MGGVNTTLNTFNLYKFLIINYEIMGWCKHHP